MGKLGRAGLLVERQALPGTITPGGTVLPVAGESCTIPGSQQRPDLPGTLRLAVGCREDGAKEETEAGVTRAKGREWIFRKRHRGSAMALNLSPP